MLHHLPTARALTVKIAGNRAAPPVRRCLGIIGSWAPGITMTEPTLDQGGHDHSHDDGLWARVKHAVVPHSHDARTSGHAPFARTNAAQSGDTLGLLDASMNDVPRAADVPVPDRLPSAVRTLRAPLFVLSVLLCAAMAAGAHGLLPAVAGQSGHSHTLQHSEHGHHHVSEQDLQPSTQSQQRRIRTRRSGQQHARPYCRPRWRRWRLRAPPHRWLRPSPLPATNVRLRICLIRV